MEHKRNHLGTRSKRLLPQYTANWVLKGEPNLIVECKNTTVLIECTKHKQINEASPRLLLNTSNSTLRSPCPVCFVEWKHKHHDNAENISRTWPMVKELFSKSKEWDFVKIQSPAKANELGIAKTNDKVMARCLKPRADSAGDCGKLTPHTVANWLPVLNGKNPEHLLCQGHCDSKKKGKARRISIKELKARVTRERGGVWTLQCDEEWVPSSNKVPFKHNCGFKVTRYAHRILSFPKYSGQPIDTPDDCPYCSNRLDLRSIDGIEELTKIIESLSNNGATFIGKTFPTNTNSYGLQLFEVKCNNCNKEYLATSRGLRSNEHHGCEVCAQTASIKQRAWVLEEAQTLLDRRGYKLTSNPASYEGLADIITPAGKTIEASIIHVIREFPLSLAPSETDSPSIRSRAGYPYTADEIRSLKRMIAEKKYHWEEIAVYLKRSSHSVKQQARRLGLDNNWPGVHVIYRTNNNAFSTITNASAFFAGLIAADGSIVANKRNIRLELKAIDETMMFELMKFLELRKSIKYRITESQSGSRGLYASVAWSNRDHLSDLESQFGVSSSKTLELSPPDFTNDNQGLAFLAGLLAGDGHFLNKKSTKLINFCTASSSAASWVERLCQRLGLKCYRGAVTKGRKNDIHTIDLHGLQATKLARMIRNFPQGKIGMPRKWRIIEDMCE